MRRGRARPRTSTSRKGIDQTASLAAVAEPDGVVWIKGGAYFATANEAWRAAAVCSRRTAPRPSPSPLSSLTAEAGDLVLAVEDSAYGKSRVFEIDVGVAPAVVVGGARILDSKDVLRSWSHFTNFTTTVDGAVADGEFDAADLAALVNDDKTVNIDPEGVAVGILGGAVTSSEDSASSASSARVALSTDLS
ncbi:hypothetical protein JL720_17125 [Aureococcus anophagefferens]|nr:hypothetical protein JL720_17125 [Aureococcus anophagefferens]